MTDTKDTTRERVRCLLDKLSQLTNQDWDVIRSVRHSDYVVKREGKPLKSHVSLREAERALENYWDVLS